MLAIDIMTTPAVSSSPEGPIREIARLMLNAHISAVPILDGPQHLIGIVTEGDLLRRSEIGTERKGRKWIEAFIDDGTLSALRSRAVEALRRVSLPNVCPAPGLQVD
jgi:CBS-domain-containing membrane protein